jgi:hypothetical protein
VVGRTARSESVAPVTDHDDANVLADLFAVRGFLDVGCGDRSFDWSEVDLSGCSASVEAVEDHHERVGVQRGKTSNEFGYG